MSINCHHNQNNWQLATHWSSIDVWIWLIFECLANVKWFDVNITDSIRQLKWIRYQRLSPEEIWILIAFSHQSKISQLDLVVAYKSILFCKITTRSEKGTYIVRPMYFLFQSHLWLVWSWNIFLNQKIYLLQISLKKITTSHDKCGDDFFSFFFIQISRFVFCRAIEISNIKIVQCYTYGVCYGGLGVRSKHLSAYSIVQIGFR